MEDNARFEVVDKVTGLITTEIHDGDRIIRKASMDAIAGKELNFNKGSAFMKVYDSGMRKIRKELTNAQCSFICHMLPQVEWETNILRNDDGTIMEVKDIELITGMCYESNRKIMCSLIEKGVMGRFTTGCIDVKDLKFECFVMNPYIFHKGIHLMEGLTELFAKTGWDKD